MARSLLGSFVSGARQMLAVQLFVSVAAVGVAGWTLAVTNDVIRQRNALNERVIQLEQDMGARGIVPPAPVKPEETAPPAEQAYPELAPPPAAAPPEPAAPAPTRDAIPDARPQAPAAPQPETAPPRPTAAETLPFDPAQILREVFTPAPPLGLVVLHVRGETDAALAQRLAQELSAGANVRVEIETLAPGDPRQSGYAFFDGRQSRAAAALTQRFADIARAREIAPWAARLRGALLPAQAGQGADRLDIVLPPLEAQGPTLRFGPALRERLTRPPG